MFCHKCGCQLPESSVFCQKCGNKLIADNTTQQIPIEPKSKPVVLTSAPQSPDLTAPQKLTTAALKKSPKKLIFVLAGIAVLAVIALIIAVSIGGDGDDTNLFQLASGVSPKTADGFDATYEDIFRWLMTNRTTHIEQQGDIAYLTYGGKVTGGDYPVSVVLRVNGLGSDDTRVFADSMTLNGMDVPDFSSPGGTLADLFWAHDNKGDYPTFMDFVRWDNENASGKYRAFLEGQDGQFGGTVPDTSSNSRLVGQWTPVSDDFIDFFNPLDTEFFSDGIVVAQGNLSEIIGLWTDYGNGQLSVVDEAGDTYMFSYEISGGSLTLSDSDGDSIIFRMAGGAGGSTGQGMSDRSGTAAESSASNEVLYMGIPVSSLLGSVDDTISLLGNPPGSDEFKLYYDDIEFRHSNGYINSFESFSLNLFEVNGTTLETNSAGLTVFVIDDRYGEFSTGVNAMEGDIITLYGYFTGNQSLIQTYTHNGQQMTRDIQAPTICSDRLVVNSIAPDPEEFAKVFIETLNAYPGTFAPYENEYISGTKIKVVCRLAGYNKDAVWPYNFQKGLMYVDGYALVGFVVSYNNKSASNYGFLESLPVDISDGELYWMIGTVEYNNSYGLESARFELESIEPYTYEEILGYED